MPNSIDPTDQLAIPSTRFSQLYCGLRLALTVVCPLEVNFHRDCTTSQPGVEPQIVEMAKTCERRILAYLGGSICVAGPIEDHIGKMRQYPKDPFFPI